MQTSDKTVVITGGTQGLGKELAILFGLKGAKVFVCGKVEVDDRDLSVGNIHSIKADVANEEDMKRLAGEVIEKRGAIDIWINNAGIWLPHASIENTDWKRAHDLIEVNLFGTVYGSKHALIQMRKQNSGMIVNILSTSALEGRPNSSSYCASKYATNGFTKSLREEVKGTNIKVISVFPDKMQTDLFDENKPADYEKYMSPKFVAEKIVANVLNVKPEEELVIRT